MREDAITPEERKIYTEYSKNLKSKLSKELGVPIKVTASKSVMSNPYIEVRVANYEKDVIPNEFRKKVMDKMGWNPMDPNNINYGNVRSNSIALRYSEWVKVMGESMTKAESFIKLCEGKLSWKTDTSRGWKFPDMEATSGNITAYINAKDDEHGNDGVNAHVVQSLPSGGFKVIAKSKSFSSIEDAKAYCQKAVDKL